VEVKSPRYSVPRYSAKARRLNPARVFVRLEKFEQAAIVRLLLSMGAEVFVLGTRRPRHTRCRSCGAAVPESQTTRQSPGLPDLLVYLKRPGGERKLDLLVIECKKFGTKLRPDQIRFKQFSERADVKHVVGTYDDVLRYLVATGYLPPQAVTPEMQIAHKGDSRHAPQIRIEPEGDQPEHQEGGRSR
jgi:hypothetical protein